MAETTTAVNGCDVAIWLANIAGVLKDISGSSNQIGLKLNAEIGDYRVFKQKWLKRLGCGKDAEAKLVVVYTTAADEGLDILKEWFFAAAPGNREMSIYIPDKNVGADHFNGLWRLKDLDIPVNAGEGKPITVTATLLSDGEITLVTNAT